MASYSCRRASSLTASSLARGVARKSWTRSRATSWLGSYFFFVFGLGDVVLEIDGADHPEGACQVVCVVLPA